MRDVANSERMRDLWAGFLTRTQLGSAMQKMIKAPQNFLVEDEQLLMYYGIVKDRM